MPSTSLPKEMRALQLKSFAKDKASQADPYVPTSSHPVPSVESLKPHEVLLKIVVAGMCATDGDLARGDGQFEAMLNSGKGFPIVPSHEPSGYVVGFGSKAQEMSKAATGAEAQQTLEIGDRVGSLTFKDFCGKCEDCQNGRVKYCDDSQAVGLSQDGAFAEYMVADVRSLAKLPDGLPFEAAAPLTCAGITIWTAIKGCNLKQGQHLAIVGAGALGHLGCQLAKSIGLKVTVIDAREAPLDLCRALKWAPDATINVATSGVDSSDPASVAEKIVPKMYNGRPSDATIISTDHLPAYPLSYSLTRKHGQVQVVGQPQEDIPVPFVHLVFRDIRITGSLLGDQRDLKELMDLVHEKGIEVKTKAFRLDEVPKLLEAYTQPGHAGKLVVRVSDD